MKVEWANALPTITDPVVKLSAARDAIMVARMAKDDDVNLAIRLGGELVRDGWGDGFAFCVLDQLKTNEDRLSVEFNPENWKDDRQTLEAWHNYVRDVDEFLGKRSTSTPI